MNNNQVTVINTLATVILPPLGVFFKEGLGWQFVINVLLTLFGYVPGIVHGLYILLRKK